MAASNSRPWNIGRAKARSFCSTKMRRCSGVLPCPGAAGGDAASHHRLPTHPLSQSQINAQERLKRQAWQPYRGWSRITSGVLLDVIGAVQYALASFIKLCPILMPTNSVNISTK